VTAHGGRPDPARIAPFTVRTAIGVALAAAATALLSPVIPDAGWVLVLLVSFILSTWLLQWSIRNARRRPLTGLRLGVATGLAALPGIVSLVVFDNVPAFVMLIAFAGALIVYLWLGWRDPGLA
jgi:thiol:disulfide interchange protein